MQACKTVGTATLIALFVSLALRIPAQDPATQDRATPEPGAKQARALLDRALERMAGLSGYCFSGEVDLGRGDAPGNAGLLLSSSLGGNPVGRRIEGSWHASGLVAFKLDAADQGVLHRGLALYRSGNRWRPRLATGPAGEPLWWVPDPARLLAELTDGPAQVTIARSETLAQRPMRVLEITFEGDRATDLLLAGMAPDPSKVPPPMRQGRSIITTSVLGGRSLPKDLKYTFELWMDPSTGLVHRLSIHGSSAHTGSMLGGAMVIQMGGQRLPAEPKPSEEDPKTMEVKLHLRFSDHGQAPTLELPSPVLRRLGLPAATPPAQREI